jgi:hypothetical protein
MHGLGKDVLVTLGYFPSSRSNTGRYQRFGGSLFSEAQATLHALQDVHFRVSRSMTQRSFSAGFLSARSRSSCILTNISFSM